MSLCEEGSGHLKTHVTWEDVEEALSESFGIPCKFGPNRKATQIGEGMGFMSKIALIDPDWEFPSERLPEKFVVKICSQLCQMEFDEENAKTPKMEKFVKETHNSEVDTYSIFEQHRTAGLKVAKVFASRKFSETNRLKGFLVLPFFENLANVNVIDNLKLEEVEQVLEALAEIGSVSLRLSENEKQLIRKDVFTSVVAIFWSESLISRNMEAVKQFAGKEYSDLVDKLDSINHEITSLEHFKHLDDLCDLIGMTCVITHADFWSTNFLWSKNGENLTLEAIVDWQSPVLSTPAIDICTLICSSLSGKDRLQNTDYVLEKYYSLLEKKVTGDMPFTLNQLKESFIHLFPFHGFKILGILMEIYGFGIRNGKELPDKTQILEKVHGLLESISFYYDFWKKI